MSSLWAKTMEPGHTAVPTRMLQAEGECVEIARIPADERWSQSKPKVSVRQMGYQVAFEHEQIPSLSAALLSHGAWTGRASATDLTLSDYLTPQGQRVMALRGADAGDCIRIPYSMVCQLAADLHRVIADKPWQDFLDGAYTAVAQGPAASMADAIGRPRATA